MISANAKQSWSKGPNNLEMAGAAILRDLGVEFEEQVLMFNKFLVDVKVSGLDLVIQWDGDYWHGFRGDGDERPLDHRQLKRARLDESQDAYMRKCGYTVIRFWEHEVHKQPEKVSDSIRRAIQNASR